MRNVELSDMLSGELSGQVSGKLSSEVGGLPNDPTLGEWHAEW